MKELKRSNDPVYLSWAIDLLHQHGLSPLLLDHHTSVLEGSINALQKRLMIDEEDYDQALEILQKAEAGL